MDNQHKKISGYRELSQQEVDLMNEIKELASEIEATLHKCKHDLYNSGHGADYISEGGRCLSLAKDNLQQGVMWAIRSVAQPTTFG